MVNLDITKYKDFEKIYNTLNKDLWWDDDFSWKIWVLKVVWWYDFRRKWWIINIKNEFHNMYKLSRLCSKFS